jgi:hypothetical protein
MSNSQDHKELFRQPALSEVLSMVRSMLDTYDIESDEALALLGSIHAGLRHAKGQDGSVYARYAQTMALLQHQMPEIHQHVVANWQIFIHAQNK